MKTRPQTSTTRPRSDHSRAILWALIAAYTFVLPDVILIYRAIVDRFGKEAAGKVPVIMVVILGIAYGAAVVLSHRSLKNLLFLLPSGVIAFLIIRLVENPNKHIHIPEYILAVWLLYAVLSKDYRGRGLFILVFVCATLLGVVDELEQGIHPKRFYGLSDMIVNSASALIGIFTIMGLKLKRVTAMHWAWTTPLKRLKPFIGLVLFGFIGIIITCAYLFRVQASQAIQGVYPAWLMTWNVLYLLSAPVIAHFGSAHQMNPLITRGRRSRTEAAETRTARLWIMPLLVILLYMHALAVYICGSGMEFN